MAVVHMADNGMHYTPMMKKLNSKKVLVKRLGLFICPIGVLIITLLSSKNCTKLLNVAIAIIMARGDKYDSRKNDESLEVI